MKTPKYTDGRYNHGYTLATATDIKRTFARVRREREQKTVESYSQGAIYIHRTPKDKKVKP